LGSLGKKYIYNILFGHKCFNVTIGTNKYNHMKVVCLHVGPSFTWQNILHVNKEYLVMS
jgi:hypothetical protein